MWGHDDAACEILQHPLFNAAAVLGAVDKGDVRHRSFVSVVVLYCFLFFSMLSQYLCIAASYSYCSHALLLLCSAVLFCFLSFSSLCPSVSMCACVLVCLSWCAAFECFAFCC